ncbi:MAG: glycoside hydrolase family 3 C-terminal domain-containing protein [Bacteroidales bacterium]|nr:glycoside hydrolase family 3 C-terminal domain-containing protein [Bacteroidales bacterium]MCM1147196.1 glycoside hydrolase family 3 C-terminal domain-containing protein [Bacteroidales bacterium]MCM1205422.1 glycoside hydrolase family 3 C-terminal domain-containing protein [Bacillota bacterium]MCM1509773.1 glycoside hydrolase family 3 C-terminal domain-containing protein [Clostridium sp.]
MKQKVLLAAFAVAALSASADDYPWMDTTLSFHERAKLLCKELTLREKVDQLGNNVSEPVKRNGVTILPSYQYWNEAIHGVARSGAATSFPESKGMSATWDPQLVYDCASVISDEARIYHVNTGKGLNYWSPTINMARDPRWGREEENYGEDPFLTGSLAVEFIKGFQGEITPTTPYYKIIACAKHFAANNYEQGRQSTTSFVSEKNMREYYLPAFEMSVKNADVKSVMAAYNAFSTDINEVDAAGQGKNDSHGGLPCAGNRMLLTDILRNEWGFSGYVVSDCAGLSCIYRDTKHLYFGGYTVDGTINNGKEFSAIHNPYAGLPSQVQPIMEARAATLAIKAGCDTNCEFMNQSSVMQRAAVNATDPAFQAQEKDYPIKNRKQTAVINDSPSYINLTEADIDAAVVRVLETRFALGEFDNYTYPVDNTLESEKNQALALKAAQESITLLKNEGDLLPISTDKKVALIGPYADAIMLGDYSGTPTYTTTPYEAFTKKLDFTLSKTRTGEVPAVPFDKAVVSKRGAASNDKGAGNLENTAPGDIFLYEQVDFGEAGCTNFAMSCGAKSSGIAKVSFCLDSKDNAPFLTVDNVDTGAWTKWATVTADIDPSVVNGVHDLYVKFSGSQSYCGNYQYFNFTNPDSPQIPVEETQGPLYLCKTTTNVNDIAPADMIRRAVDVAKKADVVIFLGGTNYDKPADHATGTESHDRWQLTLPGNQEEVLKALHAANPNTVLVLETGSSMDISWAKANVPAIMEAWYGGQAQGQAICDAVYGDINPGGKLTSTWYNSIEELPSEDPAAANYSEFKRKGMMEYNIDDWGYTYMYYGKGSKNPCQAEKPMYPFGYGLSYTTFEYEAPVLNMTSISKTSGDAVVSVNVKNTGKRDGAEVVQVYATFGGNSYYGNLNKRLVGFKRVEVKAGETVKAEIPVSYRSLAYFNTEAHNFQVPACTVTLEVAKNSADETAKTVSLNAQAGVAEDSYISTNIDEFPVVSGSSQLAKTDHVYTVMGAYVCPASEYDKLPKGVYVLNGYKYIKK